MIDTTHCYLSSPDSGIKVNINGTYKNLYEIWQSMPYQQRINVYYNSLEATYTQQP